MGKVGERGKWEWGVDAYQKKKEPPALKKRLATGLLEVDPTLECGMRVKMGKWGQVNFIPEK